MLVDQLEEMALERNVLGQRFEDEVGFVDGARQVGIVSTGGNPIGDGFRAGGVLGGTNAGFGLIALACKHRDLEACSRKDASCASAHRSVGADNYDFPDIVAQSDSPSRRFAAPGATRPGRLSKTHATRASATMRRVGRPTSKYRLTQRLGVCADQRKRAGDVI